MRQQKSTITVGIPAYNEEANLVHLLIDLLNQVEKRIDLEKIIVYSDGSTDTTNDKVNTIKDARIKVISNKVRKGQAYAQNQIINNTSSDILVLLNADIIIKDPLFLEKLTRPVVDKRADLTSAEIQELKSETFIQKLLDSSMKLKKNIFKSYNKGNNIYTCHGRARAFSKRFYKNLIFKHSVAEDAFSYLFCKSRGFSYTFVRKAEVFYKLPSSFLDHEKQSVRFYQSQDFLSQGFSNDFIKSEYHLPRLLVLKAIIKFISINPLIILYFIIASLIKIKSLFKNKSNETWDISTSSKVIRNTL